MYDRLEPYKEMEYSANMEYLLSILKKQKENKPSEIVDKMISTCLEIVYYVNSLHINRRAYEHIISEQHQSKNALKIKIRELQEKLDDIELNNRFDNETTGND
jgi:hypothetical protein